MTYADVPGWILRDVAVCGLCGARIAAAYQRLFYRCSHECQPDGCIPGRDVEAQAEPLIITRLKELQEEFSRAPHDRECWGRPASLTSQFRSPTTHTQWHYSACACFGGQA
jgi:hypothetical protein